MAINLQTEFTPRIDPPTPAYPTGSIKDSTTPTSNDGTPLRAVWGNDWQGFSDALLAAAGISASGVADTALASQRMEALLAVIGNALGLIPVSGGGALEVGKRYWILDSNTYTLPDVTSFTGGENVELYKAGAAVTPTIQVEGSNSEEINYYQPRTGTFLESDTSASYNIFAPISFIFNNTDGDWEL